MSTQHLSQVAYGNICSTAHTALTSLDQQFAIDHLAMNAVLSTCVRCSVYLCAHMLQIVCTVRHSIWLPLSTHTVNLSGICVASLLLCWHQPTWLWHWLGFMGTIIYVPPLENITLSILSNEHVNYIVSRPLKFIYSPRDLLIEKWRGKGAAAVWLLET